MVKYIWIDTWQVDTFEYEIGQTITISTCVWNYDLPVVDNLKQLDYYYESNGQTTLVAGTITTISKVFQNLVYVEKLGVEIPVSGCLIDFNETVKDMKLVAYLIELECNIN